MATPTPFAVRATDDQLEDLAYRLAHARLPPSEVVRRGGGGSAAPGAAALDPNGAWTAGTPRACVEELSRYWRDDFLPRWRAEHEPRLNSLRQFTLRVRVPAADAAGHGAPQAAAPHDDDNGRGGSGETLVLHFVHERALPDGGGSGGGGGGGSSSSSRSSSSRSPRRRRRAAPIPLLLVHGWPGSFVEFLRLVPLLTAAGFDVVAPSLPGYGFSDAPRRPGADAAFMARAAHALMLSLGYAHYVAQGGDWGAIITQRLATAFPTHCVALHVNMCVPRLPEDALGKLQFGLRTLWLSAAERRGVKDTLYFLKYEAAYQAVQGTKPESLGYGLTDSPVGLLAWIVEKMHTWSDCHRRQHAAVGSSSSSSGRATGEEEGRGEAFAGEKEAPTTRTALGELELAIGRDDVLLDVMVYVRSLATSTFSSSTYDHRTVLITHSSSACCNTPVTGSPAASPPPCASTTRSWANTPPAPPRSRATTRSRRGSTAQCQRAC